MSEPASTAAGGWVLYKLAGMVGLMAVLAAIVVMAMTLPRSPREFSVSLISTVVSSLSGGSFVIRYFDIGHWALDDFGIMALGGIIFVCGLPAWVFVRGWFAYAAAREHMTIIEIIQEIRQAVWK